MCVFEPCSRASEPFETRQEWVSHTVYHVIELNGQADPVHPMINCPLCLDDMKGGHVKHISAHLEEVALGAIALHADVESDCGTVTADADDDESRNLPEATNLSKEQGSHTSASAGEPQESTKHQTTDDGEEHTIQCICGICVDDGQTIFCETCERWQHIACYYPDYEDEAMREDLFHSCVECTPRPLNFQRAQKTIAARTTPAVHPLAAVRDSDSEEVLSSAFVKPSDVYPGIFENLPVEPEDLVPQSTSSEKQKCPYCAMEFLRHINLKSHLLTHSREKPYHCQTCDMKFRRPHDLKRHSKLHRGDRPHVCLKCDRRFARGEALARHSKGAGACAGRRLDSLPGDDDQVDTDADDSGNVIGQSHVEVLEGAVVKDNNSTSVEIQGCVKVMKAAVMKVEVEEVEVSSLYHLRHMPLTNSCFSEIVPTLVRSETKAQLSPSKPG